MTTCLFLTLSLAVILVIVNSCSRLNKLIKKNELNQQLDFIFSFIKILDSKYIGLFVFLFSNVLTGIVNLSMQTIYMNDFSAFLIVSVYIMLVISTSYFFYFKKTKDIKKLE
jgi:hypothetical protein